MALLLLIGLWPALAAAQDSGDQSTLKRERDAAFQEILRNPTDLDASFRYADLATRLGDYEGAITAMERMLFINPDLPRVKLELGALYFRLGSYDVARAYFQEVLDTGNPPPEVRRRVGEFLAAIDRAQSRNHFAGTIFLGIQAQSDANASPSSPDVRVAIGGVPVTGTLDSRFTRKYDNSLVFSSFVQHSYDLQTQERDSIETTAAIYASRFQRQTQVDLDIVELTSGPRLGLGRIGLPNGQFRPYVILNGVALGDTPYFQTYGAGFSFTEPLADRLLFELTYEHREKNYHGTDGQPVIRLYTGHDDIGAAALTYFLTDRWSVGVSGAVIGQTTRADFFSNLEFDMGAATQIRYDAPFGVTRAPWTTAFAVTRATNNYISPDPSVDPFTKRFDRRWRFGLVTNIGITEHWGVILQLERDVISSTIPNYAYNDSSVLIGPQFRF